MHYQKEAILRYYKLTPSVVSEKNWNTKEDKGKSMMMIIIINFCQGKKFHKNLLEGFKITLKAILGLAKLTNTPKLF